MVGVVGCGPVQESLQRASEIVQENERPQIVAVDAPDAALARDGVVAQAARSVVKIQSVVPSCQKVLEGSGVVVGPDRVMSAAHTVAGADTVTVSVDGRELPAAVVAFDPAMDVSVLDVPDLQAPALEFAWDSATTGSDALVLGYPGGGDYTANPARIRETIQLTGPDIYRTTTVTREVYVIRGEVGQGDSGGPLIDRSGRILGLNFGAAVDDPQTGFVLTARQVGHASEVADDAQPVSTGECVH
jgi:S1-C subfamily serine protease